MSEIFFCQRWGERTKQRMLVCFTKMHGDSGEGAADPPIDLNNNVTASAGCGAITWWLEQENPYSPEQLAQWLNKLLYDLSSFQGPANPVGPTSGSAHS